MSVEISPELKELGDKISELTLKQAKELSDYLNDEYGIEPAAGGAAVMVAPSAAGEEAGGEVAKTEFDVVLTGFGDKKLNVVKAVKNITGSTLMEAKKLVESAPATLKEKVPTEEAEKIKADLEKEGASIELK